MTKYTVKPTTQFKKDYKLAIKRGLKIELLEEIISNLANGVPLPKKNKDHALGGLSIQEDGGKPPDADLKIV